MRNASALSRLVAPMIAVGILVGGCGQTPSPRTADHRRGPCQRPLRPERSRGRRRPRRADGRGHERRRGKLRPGGPSRETCRAGSDLPESCQWPRTRWWWRTSPRTAVLIGDSQSEPVVSAGPGRALASLGYTVYFCGRGGTGFVASNGRTGNYIDALQRGDWLLPYGSPPLVVIEGGGNDASRGATDEQISTNAERLIASVRQRYPEARLAMVGTLARGAADGGGRRTEVDALLGTVAAAPSHSLCGRRGLADPPRPHRLDGRRRPHEPRRTRGAGRAAGQPAGRSRLPVPGSELAESAAIR